MGGFFIMRRIMNIYVYSDESGVFDKVHNDFFVFGGIICIGNDSKEVWSRRYSSVEKAIKNQNHFSKDKEVKATTVSNRDKNKLFRSLGQCYKFAVVIKEKCVLDRIFNSKKDKQRYMDYAYKIAVKRAFEELISQNVITPTNVERIYFFVDEHTTATNGCYELRESLEQEFKLGTYNYNYGVYYPPIFPDVQEINLKYCNSATTLLIRAADIVANKIYYLVRTSQLEKKSIRNIKITYLP